ncbi:MAG TPA: hypothetical protein VEZ50_09380 [Nodosilinea sp.]|nr:hypothetical protein [Nodosilinea sp.]
MVRHHYSRRYADGATALQALEAALAPAVPTVVVSPKAPAPTPQPQKQGWLQGLFGTPDTPKPAPKPQAQAEADRQRREAAAQRQREEA